jgi:hypothetical protein
MKTIILIFALFVAAIGAEQKSYKEYVIKSVKNHKSITFNL